MEKSFFRYKNEKKNLPYLLLLIPVIAIPLLAIFVAKEEVKPVTLTLKKDTVTTYEFADVGTIITVNLDKPISSKYYFNEVDNKDYSEYLEIKEIEPLMYSIEVLNNFETNFFKFEISNLNKSDNYYLNLTYITSIIESITLNPTEVIF